MNRIKFIYKKVCWLEPYYKVQLHLDNEEFFQNDSSYSEENLKWEPIKNCIPQNRKKIIILEIWNYFSFSPTKTEKNRNENLKLKFLHSLKQDEKMQKLKFQQLTKRILCKVFLMQRKFDCHYFFSIVLVQ